MENNETGNKLDVSSFVIDKHNLYLKMVLTKFMNNVSRNRDIIILIDKSGSMSGNPIDKIKIIVNQLLDFMKENIKLKSLSIYSFDDQVHGIFEKNIDSFSDHIYKFSNFVNNIQANGGTIFSKPLNSISDFIWSSESVDLLTVILLTDGEVCQDDKEKNYFKLNNSIKRLKESIQLRTSATEFHTLGFSKDHDPIFLDQITTLSYNMQGTYQFIKEVADLENAFENISFILQSDEAICGNFMSVTKQINDVKVKFNTMKDIVPNNLQYETDVIITDVTDTEILSLKECYLEICLNVGQSVKIFPSNITEIGKSDKITSFKIDMKLIHNSLQNISQKLVNSSKNQIPECQLDLLNQEFIALRNKFNNSQRDFFQIPISKREEIREYLKSISDYINILFELINSAYKNKINNEIIAKVNSLAYKEIINKKILKRLEKRTSQNVKLLNDINIQIKDHLRNLNFEDLEKKYIETVMDIGDCFLSCNNFIESMKEGDCLCITFNVSRDELTIMKPSSLIINQVFPTIVSANSFLDAIKFSMNASKLNSGGFDPNNKESSIIKGTANENINGCLPIFICKEHWNFAKLLMIPILGWTCTLDPIGYSVDQRRVIPFLLLNKVGIIIDDLKTKKERNTFYEKLFENLKLTCIGVFEEDQEKYFDSTLKEMFEKVFTVNNYISCPEIGLEEMVASNCIFIPQMAISLGLKWSETPNNSQMKYFFIKIVEEEVRRKYNSMAEKNENILTFYVKMLNITDEIEIYSEKMKIWIDKEKERLKEHTQNETNNPKPESIVVHINKIIIGNEFNPEQKKAIEEFSILVENEGRNLGKLFNIHFPLVFDGTDLNNVSILKLIGCETKEQILALFLHTRFYRKASDKKKAILSMKYRDYLKLNDCVLFLEELSSIVIESESDRLTKWKKIIFHLENSKTNKHLPTDEKSKLILTLLNTEDLDEAYECFIKLKWKSIKKYFRLFKFKDTIMAFEKVQMIVTGKYKNNIISQDWANKLVPMGRRKNIRKLIRKYKEQSKYEQWATLFSDYKL